MTRPPTDDELAQRWWQALSDRERAIWITEALREIGPDDPRRESDLPVACWKLFRDRSKMPLRPAGLS